MVRKNRGEEKLISMYWFLILTLIAGGIVLMTNSFYSSPYDVREVEAEVLANKVSDCIYHGGRMNPMLNSNNVFREEFKDNFLERCDMNFDTFAEFEQVEYYASVDFYSSGNLRKSVFKLEDGNVNLLEDCKVEVEKKKLSRCYNNEFWARSPDGKVYLVKILTIINKGDRNVK